MNPQEVLEYAKNNDARQLDVRFTDIPSLQHHISYPISELTESSFEEGFGIDGSSIRGWAAINESDMLLDSGSHDGVHGSVRRNATLVMIGDVIDPITKQHYERDPRWIAKKAELLPEEHAARATPRFSAPKPSFSFSTTSASTRTSIPVSISSTPKKAAGIRAARRTTWATGRATRKATSRCRPPITIRICAARWCRP